MANIVPVHWVVHIVDFIPGRQYADFQLQGPFRYFVHTHLCLPECNGTLYRDSIEYRTHFGTSFDRTLIRRKLEKIFTYRHRRMKELLEHN
jgi:ligand-binding SRPBCC domain-containing protein